MSRIPDEVLESLKCSLCERYLSSKPVILQPSGENLCGICAKSDGVQNKVYEQLARLHLFPCRFSKEGCNEMFLFNENMRHEEECQYQYNECPMSATDNCSWSGNIKSLKMHYQEKHPSKIVKHPYHFQSNIMSNNTTCVLMEIWNYLFLVQIQCNMAAAKLWYCVKFIGNAKFASLFEFTVNMNYKTGKLTQKKNVKPFERFYLKGTDVMEIDITGLLKIIGINTMKSMEISIVVNLKNPYCLICNKNNQEKPIYLDYEGYYCKLCIESKSRCKCKNSKSCNYNDIKINLDKHEFWLCKHTKHICNKKTCWKKVKHNNESLMDHIIRYHIKEELTSYPNFSGLLQRNILYGAVLYLDDLKFIINCIFSNEGFKYTVITNLSKLNTMEYKCILRVNNPTTGKMYETEMKRDIFSKEYDWVAIIKDDILNDPHGTIPKFYKCQISVKHDNIILFN